MKYKNRHKWVEKVHKAVNIPKLENGYSISVEIKFSWVKSYSWMEADEDDEINLLASKVNIHLKKDGIHVSNKLVPRRNISHKNYTPEILQWKIDFVAQEAKILIKKENQKSIKLSEVEKAFKIFCKHPKLQDCKIAFIHSQRQAVITKNNGWRYRCTYTYENKIINVVVKSILFPSSLPIDYALKMIK